MFEWIVGAWKAVRSAPAALKRLRELDRYEATVSHRERQAVLVEQNLQLRERIAALEGSLKDREELTFAGSAYWLGNSRDEQAGPFCSRCKDVDGKRVRMSRESDGSAHCTQCAHNIRLDGRHGGGGMRSDYDPFAG